MSLHLHYEFRAPAAWSRVEAGRVVAELRVRALDLPCVSVSELFEHSAAADQPLVEFDTLGSPDAARFGRTVIQLTQVPAALTEIARLSREVPSTIQCIPDPEERRKCREYGIWAYEDLRHIIATVMPEHACLFHVRLGEGADTLPIGLGRYPAQLGGHPTRYGDDWWWEESGSLQYAANAGDDNLLTCYKSAVALFDRARELGLAVRVHDDTGYEQLRDDAMLLARVRQANAFTAAIVGAVKDSVAAENRLEAPILDHPEFEHLEAEGRGESSRPGRGEETS